MLKTIREKGKLLIEKINNIFDFYIIQTYINNVRYFLDNESMTELIIKAYDYEEKDMNIYFYDERWKLVYILNKV